MTGLEEGIVFNTFVILFVTLFMIFLKVVLNCAQGPTARREGPGPDPDPDLRSDPGAADPDPENDPGAAGLGQGPGRDLRGAEWALMDGGGPRQASQE